MKTHKFLSMASPFFETCKRKNIDWAYCIKVKNLNSCWKLIRPFKSNASFNKMKFNILPVFIEMFVNNLIHLEDSCHWTWQRNDDQRKTPKTADLGVGTWTPIPLQNLNFLKLQEIYFRPPPLPPHTGKYLFFWFRASIN